jgi:TDG/mug DNA glycosylase family protein
MNAVSPPPAPGRITGLAPVTGSAPEVLILGSFPSRQSLSRYEYYGNPRNHFWQIAEAVLAIDRNLPYTARVAHLADRGIALWDVIHSCRREGSADLQIREPVYNDLAGFLAAHPTVRLIALNGTAAGRFWHAATSPSALPSRIPVLVLPSTSPANARIPITEKIRRWQVIRTSVAGAGAGSGN